MRMYDLIDKKKNGGALSAEEDPLYGAGIHLREYPGLSDVCHAYGGSVFPEWMKQKP